MSPKPLQLRAQLKKLPTPSVTPRVCKGWAIPSLFSSQRDTLPLRKHTLSEQWGPAGKGGRGWGSCLAHLGLCAWASTENNAEVSWY